VASPNRETEAMMDGTDAVSDWPLLNALLSTSGGPPGSRSTMAAAWAWALLQHAGLVIVADRHGCGGQAAGSGTMERSRHRRHAACRRRYEIARKCAHEKGLNLPMLP